MEPWHLIQSYRVLRVIWCLEIRYGVGMPTVPLWTLQFFKLFLFGLGRETRAMCKEGV